MSKLQNLHDECFPLRKQTKKEAKDKIWITPALKKSCSIKSKLYKKWIKTKSQSDKDKYNEYKKILAKLCKKAQEMYYSEALDTKVSSSRKVWDTLHKLISNNKQKKHNIVKLKEKNSIITDESAVAEKFNKFFTNIGPSLAGQLNSSSETFKKYLKNSNVNTIYVQPVDTTEILNIIGQLDSSKSSNDTFLNARFLKIYADLLAYPLMYIFNLSLEKGEVPELLKIAKVTPIFKKGEKSDINNYRPISLLSVINKLLEKIVYNRVYKFFDTFNILYQYQFGFRAHHSTSLALIDVVDYCYNNLSRQNDVVGIYIDLTKAFDTVDHEILLQKLSHYGIRGPLLKWFCSYLTDRRQFCVVNGSESSTLPLTTGVPQGSVLGPLLFLVYMNDISCLSNNIKLFADDTNVFLTGSNKADIENTANSVLSKISEWMTANKLTTNINKTCYTIFKSKKNQQYDLNISMGTTMLKEIDSAKYLGLYIDHQLKWEDHIEFLHSKLMKFVGIFFKLRTLLPQKCLRTIYFSMIYPHLLYGIEVYANCTNKALNKLNILNNKLIRTLLNKSLSTPVNSLYKSFRVLPINKLHIFNILLLVHRVLFCKDQLPTIFHTYFTPVAQKHNYFTRGHKLYIESSTNNMHHKLISVKGALLYNRLPTHLKQLSYNQFKSELHNFLLSNEFS